MEQQNPGLRRRRRLARVCLLSAAAALAVLGVFAGLRTFALLAVGLVGAVLTLVAVWWILSRRGVLRYLAVLLALAAPVWVVVAYVRAGLLWVVLVSGALWLAATGAGRAALTGPGAAAATRERRAPEFRHPVLIMNPRSGGGKVERFRLRERAGELGAEVVLLGTDGETDVAALARACAARGADLLGVAGGDGTQALVAEVAADLGLPFLVVPAGTRNHFALDLGLDRDDPATALDALRDGVELRVDLGRAAGRPFVNNVSFGAYAEVVQSPSYRDGKTRTTLDLLPGLLVGHRGARLTARAGEHTFEDPQALLVSNNPYGERDIAGLGRRARIDGGVLGCVGVRVTSAAQAAGLLRGGRATGLTRARAATVTVDADRAELPVGIDGEAVRLPVPVRCEIRAGALRVVVPRRRPGGYRERPALDWRTIAELGLTKRS
ncbi:MULTISPECIES: diacylglycerol kinase family protein [unclassified Streptomyces]|uniref:diacylglycerol/lipid kinase family protein n=1 Tax=unclassified Streptomyces TaxID=2593676 RepID=UPI000DB9D287|nr:MULTISPECIES: diacylglycerol kinase family protein [unclassified Streptomyces]MYT74717.1 diacylglycerol kinase [Streptomyces sp. SID8367]RAJ91703.1 diacylglycerol kinase family enzyme [Streptomyces sp. PsTaAH-137]